MDFDGSLIRLTTQIAKYLTIRKGDHWFKEIVSVSGEYAQCIMCLDNGRLLIVERDGFDRQQFIVSEDYDHWRVVGETLPSDIPDHKITRLLF